jgi:trimethylamine--corrinoid protein Co-methyltransferase
MRLKPLEVLSRNEIERIDYLSRKLLAEKGILIPSDEAKKILKEKNIEFDGFVAKFDEKSIDNAIKYVPKKIRIFNRDLSDSIIVGEGNCFASGHNAIYMLDKTTNSRVPAKKDEVGKFALIADYLEEFKIAGIEAYPQDVKPRSSILHALEAVLDNTNKPVYFSPETYEETLSLLKIMRLFSDDFKNYPTGICQLSPHSPFAWDKTTINAFILLVKNNFPVVVLPAPFSFVSAPITIAGEILETNIELLGSLVIAQLVNPGTPFIYGNAKSAADMATGEYLNSTPECNLFRIASAQLAQYYGIPSHSIGPDSDSNILDIQNGFEKMSSLIAEASSGTNIIINAGMFATGMTVSFEQLVIDAEMIRFVTRLIGGVDCCEEKLAYDSLLGVEFGKDFLTDSLTLKYLRSDEHVKPMISNRKNYEHWKTEGKPDIVRNATELVKDIIENHKPKTLDKSISKEVGNIISAFEDQL